MQHDKHHNSPVKIVADENNCEIINEQVETDQVSNQENNSDCIEETNCQDSVEPEVTTCDTAFVNANDTSTENTLGASSIKDSAILSP